MPVREWSLPGPDKPLLGRAEVARWIGVHPRTLDALVAHGEFPRPQLLGKKPTWSALDVAAWMHLRGRFRVGPVDKQAHENESSEE